MVVCAATYLEMGIMLGLQVLVLAKLVSIEMTGELTTIVGRELHIEMSKFIEY